MKNNNTEALVVDLLVFVILMVFLILINRDTSMRIDRLESKQFESTQKLQFEVDFILERFKRQDLKSYDDSHKKDSQPKSSRQSQ